MKDAYFFKKDVVLFAVGYDENAIKDAVAFCRAHDLTQGDVKIQKVYNKESITL